MPGLAKVVNVFVIRQVKQGFKELELLGSLQVQLCTRVNMSAVDLIIDQNGYILSINASNKHKPQIQSSWGAGGGILIVNLTSLNLTQRSKSLCLDK